MSVQRAVDFRSVYGVDFSGARLAGRTTWVARLDVTAPGPARLADLDRLDHLCDTAERSRVYRYLVARIALSADALWAMDFPFGLPIEVMPPGAGWPSQLEFLLEWGEDAYGMGLECLRRAKLLGGPMHIRRLTDSEAKAPFDCYHYRSV